MLLMLASWLALWDFEISFDATRLAFSEACPARPWRYPLETVTLLKATLIFTWKFEHLAYLGSLGLSNTLLLLCSWLTLGFSGTPLLLRSWLSPGTVRQALDADLLTPTCSWCYALSFLLELPTCSWCFLLSLNYLTGFPALSLCFVLGHASTLLTLRSWFFLERSFCLFLWRIKLQHALDATLLASSWNIPAHSWCYVLSSGSDALLMLRAELRWTFSWNSPRCSWRYGPPQSW